MKVSVCQNKLCGGEQATYVTTGWREGRHIQCIGLVLDGHIVDLLERQIAESAALLAAFTPEQVSGGRCHGSGIS
jgi:hypothetical protein